MDIPKSIDQLAAASVSLSPALRHAFSAAEDILREGPLFFFPEYTDHGPRHVTAVIDSAASLVESDSPLTADDAAALGLSALLHDIGMHLTGPGFQTLIAKGGRWSVKGWNEKPWSQLWTDFLIDARRMDERAMIKLFGKVIAVEELGNDCLNWTEYNRMLVGEFLRVHHPRLAHEIALHGFPAANGQACPILPPSLDRKRAGLLGLIARSHGLALRAAVDRLRQIDGQYHRLAFGVRPTYLMALLRIADYMQVQPERAPTGLTKLRPLVSATSKLEWRTHACVEEIAEDVEDDPACLLIRATPPDLQTYLRLRQWLDGIQAELDQCWAVLGEVHGRLNDQPGLRLRRIKSTIDDLAKLAEDVPYHPQATRFTAADGPLLRLLVGPLYGWKPELGIRELMQNAVDAVRQRDFLCRRDDSLEPLPRDGAADVDIHIELDADGTPLAVTVTDRGLGMTAEVIQDYFLRAGATFRHSKDWKDRYLNADGGAAVERAGRFGVGALAAFLIGDRITVTTRHVESGPDEGLEFEAGLTEDLIEIRKVPGDTPVGTRIRVTQLRNAVELLNLIAEDFRRRVWDHFCLDWPRVVRRVGESELNQRLSIGNDWVRVPQGRFEDFLMKPFSHESELICGGIFVSGIYKPVVEGIGIGAAPEYPSVAVVDPDGQLKLNLDRCSLSEPLPCPDELIPLVVRHSVARALAWGITRIQSRSYSAPNLLYQTSLWVPLCQGFCMNDQTLLRGIGIRSLYILGSDKYFRYGGGTPSADGIHLPEGVTLVFAGMHNLAYERQFKFPWAGELTAALTRTPPHPDLKLIRASAMSSRPRHALYATDGTTFDLNFVETLASAVDDHLDIQLVRIDLDPDAELDTRQADAWMALVRQPFIPYSEEERRRQLPHLYEELADEIAFYQSVEDRLRPMAEDFEWARRAGLM